MQTLSSLDRLPRLGDRLDLLERGHGLGVQELDGAVLIEPGLAGVDEVAQDGGGVLVGCGLLLGYHQVALQPLDASVPTLVVIIPRLLHKHGLVQLGSSLPPLAPDL